MLSLDTCYVAIWRLTSDGGIGIRIPAWVHGARLPAEVHDWERWVVGLAWWLDLRDVQLQGDEADRFFAVNGVTGL